MNAIDSTNRINRKSEFTEAQDKVMNLAARIIPKTEMRLNSSMEMDWNYNFKDLSYVGATLLIRNAFNCLKIIDCTLQNTIKGEKPPHKLFSWDIWDFLERTNFANSHYLNEFIKNHYHDMDIIKLKTDLEIVLNILDCFIQDITVNTKLERSQQMLSGIFELLDLQANLLDEKNRNVAISKHLYQQLKHYSKDRRKESIEWHESLNTLQYDYYENTLIKFPIERRYVRNYEAARNTQLAQTKEDEDNTYISEIIDCKQKHVREQEVFSNLRDAYENQTERLKMDVEEQMAKYEEDYEKLDLEISRSQGLVDQRISDIEMHHNKYEFYKSEVERCLKEEEAAEAERAWRAMIEGGGEETDADKTKPAKSGKKKGKGKGKKDKANEPKSEKAAKPEDKKSKKKNV